METSIFADEEGMAGLVLGGAEARLLFVVLAVAGLGIVAGFLFARGVLRVDKGTAAINAIADRIRAGARTFMRRQLRAIGLMVAVLTVLVFASTPDPLGAGLSVAVGRALAFVAGASLSGLSGYAGMHFATEGNVRTTASASRGLAAALHVAFRTGAITGMFTVGLGLLGATVILMVYGNRATDVLIGFGFGGSLIALFMRVGGGIFTKAADVGADLVGKLEEKLPEDDARNAAAIADNVGDNVGDCAGMAADLFESYEVTLVASMILGAGAARSVGLPAVVGVVLPLLIRAVGVVASILGVLAVRPVSGRSPTRAIQSGLVVSVVLTAAGSALVVGTYGEGRWVFFWAVLAGLALAVCISFLTEYFTSTEHRPVRDVAAATETGAATTILGGFALGLESSVWAILAIALTIGASLGLAGGDPMLALYLVSLSGLGMLATTGVIVSMDSYGPVADNAGGIAEMSGGLTEEAERVLASLDATGNTTKAITKGFAIASAVIAAVSLFASFVETVALRSGSAAGTDAFERFPINLAEPRTFIGLLVGGGVVFLFSSLAIRAVGRTAQVVVREVRRQFRERPGILAGVEAPDSDRVIELCTRASQRELATPALLAVLSPVAVGFALGSAALGAFLGAVILTGQLMAVLLSNAGGAWDNAKKYVEAGHLGGKGSAAHAAAVTGDTVGDPFKDTAGPALNPLIKVMNLVALLVLPLVVGLRSPVWRVALSAGAVLALVLAFRIARRSESRLDDRTAGAS